MNIGILLPVLAVGTMALVIVFAVVSKRKVEQRKADAAAEKSTLAVDKQSDGKPADV